MSIIRLLCVGVLLFLGFVGCSSPSESSSERVSLPEEDMKLEKFFDEYLEFQCRVSPTFATYLGNHEYDAEVDDLSEEGIRRRLDGYSSFLSRLPTVIDRDILSPGGQADFDILQNDIAGTVFSLTKLDPYRKNPRVYSDLISDSVYALLKRDFAPLDKRVQDAISRMQRLSRIVDQAKANLRSPPKPRVEVAIRQNKGAIAFYEDGILNFVKGSTLAEAAATEGKNLAGTLREYQAWLEKELLPQANAEWKLGRELWEEKLGYSLNASLDSAEIRQRAQKEYDRVRAEMLEIAKKLWLLYFPGDRSSFRLQCGTSDDPNRCRQGGTRALHPRDDRPRRAASHPGSSRLLARKGPPGASRSRQAASYRDAGIPGGSLDGISGPGSSLGARWEELLCHRTAAAVLERRTGGEPTPRIQQLHAEDSFDP